VVEFDQILKECKQYNKFAQKLLYEMYAPKMKGLCLRYVGDSETAKDIVQDGFIKVFSNIKKFEGKGSFEGWMKRIFINTALSHLRKNNSRNKHLSVHEVDESNLAETSIHPFEKHPDFGKENIDLVLSADLSEDELLDALKKIPEAFRTVFNLFCIEKIKHEEIAQILKIDITTSRTRLLRARCMIQKELYGICLEKLKQ
jgi:RNA polymerase sigma-70 factor, ECF subfamily